tara:strand:- start:308 stop:2086 length:1779 start_codon:yes stop_codon:yes gene_type:complete
MNMPLLAESPCQENRRTAKFMYWQGFRVARIAELLDEPTATVQSWKSRDDWDAAKPIDRVEGALEARLVQLILKDPKEGKDFKEVDLLGRQIERLARVRRFEQPGGHEGDLNPKVANRNAKPKRKPVRNEINEEQAEQLQRTLIDEAFDFQRGWYEAGLKHRIRDILKSRQIGATWFFAREALVDAATTARNQIFLSASKAQAHVFKQYISQFAKNVIEVDLTGDPIVLANAAELHFLGTNARTAQSYHGNLYFDEYFWTHKFQELRKVASGMAIHKKWRQTYFSTPSSLAHDAHPFWSGKLFNRGRPKADHIDLDVSHAAMKNGKLCADGQWRQIVTIEDAMAGGCDLFDIDQLRLEYSEDEFQNLLMCQFVDDQTSVFGMMLLQRCMVDSWEVWSDYKPFAIRPMGNRRVWVGYDPNGGGEGGDSAGCVVLVPPAVPGGKFRAIEKHQWRGMDFEAQAAAIKAICSRYDVEHIGIDTTGIGAGVFQLVKQFFPGAASYQYSPEIKSRLVMKAYNVISKGRLEFDAGWTDFAASFMAIKKTMTASGRQTTYVAGRSEQTGHADLAWACMHALDHEPLEGVTGNNTGIMEFY